MRREIEGLAGSMGMTIIIIVVGSVIAGAVLMFASRSGQDFFSSGLAGVTNAISSTIMAPFVGFAHMISHFFSSILSSFGNVGSDLEKLI